MTQQVRRGRIAAMWLVGLGLLWVGAYAGDTGEGKPVVPDSTGGRVGYSPAGAAGGTIGQTGAPYVPKGQYQTLLKKIEVPQDQQNYGDFYDYGYYSGTSYAGFNDLPAGYWVYVSPHWLIYRDAGAPGASTKSVAWSPAQATGKPDTTEPGDRQSAWASATPDGQREWLELTYDGEFEAVGVMIYETFNPGAVDSVIAYAGNEQVQVWAGKDPTEIGKPQGVSVIGFSKPVKTSRVRINIDSPRVPGWNEIDAVGLLDKDGNVHWATSATASSSYNAGSPNLGGDGIERFDYRLNER